jgi:hypothetical protein
MKCDRCREQLPVGDGIDHQGQTLCLVCYLQGAASSQSYATLHCLDLSGVEAKQAVQLSIINAEFLIAQV